MPFVYLIRNSTLFLIFLLTTAINFLYGQVPVVEWQKCLGSNNEDEAKSIQPTADGGYIVAGSSEGDNGDVMGHHGNASVGDIWIVKLDKQGNIQWQKCLGGSDSEDGASILQTSDGG